MNQGTKNSNFYSSVVHSEDDIGLRNILHDWDFNHHEKPDQPLVEKDKMRLKNLILNGEHPSTAYTVKA